MAAQDLSFKKQSFMNRCVQAATQLQASREVLKALLDEWNANNYGSTIVQGDIPAPGSISHLTPTILAALFTSQGNLETYMAAGNATNINAMIGG